MLSEASIKRIELEIELHLLALQILILLLAAMKARRGGIEDCCEFVFLLHFLLVF